MMHTEKYTDTTQNILKQCSAGRGGKYIYIFMLYAMSQYVNHVLNMINILQLVLNGVNPTAFLHDSGGQCIKATIKLRKIIKQLKTYY